MELAQCGQVNIAYSTSVTGASAAPIVRSPIRASPCARAIPGTSAAASAATIVWRRVSRGHGSCPVIWRRARDSTLRANVSKAARRSPSPMLEIGSAYAARARAAGGGGRRFGAGSGRLGEARPGCGSAGCARPYPARARRSPARAAAAAAAAAAARAARSTASVSSPPAGPRARASFSGAQIAANSGPAISGQSARSRAWAKPRRAAAVRSCGSISPPARTKPRESRRGLVFPRGACHGRRPSIRLLRPEG